jgi:hypothetical protein
MASAVSSKATAEKSTPAPKPMTMPTTLVGTRVTRAMPAPSRRAAPAKRPQKAAVHMIARLLAPASPGL